MSDQLDLLDYYTLLGVDPTSSVDEVRAAFHKFALKYHPDNHSDGTPAKLARATQIFRRGAEAYRVLLDPSSRRLYDERLREGELRLSADASQVARRNSSPARPVNRKAQPFFRKAEQAIKRDDWQTAKLNLRIAAQYDPESQTVQAKIAMVETKLGKKKR